MTALNDRKLITVSAESRASMPQPDPRDAWVCIDIARAKFDADFFVAGA